MASPENIFKEIQSLTSDLISVGLSVDQNFPAIKRGEAGIISVGFAQMENLSVTLKNIPYQDAYLELSKERSYNIKLIDGALVQMMYRFQETHIISHRLAFFPSPDLLEYQNNSNLYEEDELYADIIMKNVVTTPVRFDFDRSLFVECEHPMAHLTIGQYRNCRIPVSGPLSPFSFVKFLLRSFYNTPFKRFCNTMRQFPYNFESTITNLEQNEIHIRVGPVPTSSP